MVSSGDPTSNCPIRHRILLLALQGMGGQPAYAKPCKTIAVLVRWAMAVRRGLLGQSDRVRKLGMPWCPMLT